MENTKKSPHTHADIVNAFQLTWGNHPGAVMLINKKRDILSVNKTGQDQGIVPGIKCYTLCKGSHICKHCQANKALSQGISIREVAYSEAMDAVMDGYWIPVEGSDDVYVHFGNNISDYAKREMFPVKG